jgi:phosphoribosyl 1,2-cyclic phosphodiesterase
MQLAMDWGSDGMRIVVLGSGSSGNSMVVESGGRRLLLDAGFSAKEIARRMALRGIDPNSFDAMVITHEHGDHVSGARVFAKRHGVKIYATRGTLEASGLPDHPVETGVIESGHKIQLGSFEVEPFNIPHDAREPVGVVVEDGAGNRVGLAADLGTRSQLAWAALRDLDALVLEANHDLDMLRRGPYPWSLKQRVAGRHGHLSNREAADGVRDLVCDRLRMVVLYHLSRTNNVASLAEATVGEALDREGSPAEVLVSAQNEPTEWLEVGAAAVATQLAGSA